MDIDDDGFLTDWSGERLFPNQIEKQKASHADFDKIPTTTSITPPLQPLAITEHGLVARLHVISPNMSSLLLMPVRMMQHQSSKGGVIVKETLTYCYIELESIDML